MSGKRDYYEVLGIDRSSSEKEIKKAYRKKARDCHPDSHQGDRNAEQKFKEVNEAYSVLSDPQKRKLYDQFGMAAFEEGASASQGQAGGDPFSGFYGQGTDPFGQGNPFGAGSFGQGGAFSGAYTQGGEGAWRSVHVDADDPRIKEMFGDLFDGVFRNGAGGGFSHSGTGRFYQSSDQNGSHSGFSGTGTGSYGTDGSFAGSGSGGRYAYGEPEKLDLQKELFIPFTTAVFGGEVKVATPGGSVMMKIPAGCQCGRKFRLAGKGKKSRDGSRQGDLYVVIQITVPKNLSAAEVRKLREYEHVRKEKAGGKGKKPAA